jgi:hypothetical protein
MIIKMTILSDAPNGITYDHHSDVVLLLGSSMTLLENIFSTGITYNGTVRFKNVNDCCDVHNIFIILATGSGFKHWILQHEASPNG